MDESNELLVYGARYTDVEEALEDLLRLKSLHKDGHLRSYDAAVVSREESGKIIISNTDATERGGGAALGGVAGGIIGAVFPPALLGAAAVGAAAGGIVGTLTKRLSKSDVKEIAELLEPGQSGLLVVTDGLDQAYRNTLFSKALTSRSITIHEDEDLKRAVYAEAQHSH